MNVGIIGTGSRGELYTNLCLSGIRDNVNVMALADMDANALEQFVVKSFKNRAKPELYTDYNELLDNSEIDAVIISTPDFTHREIAVNALKKEKHIILEKPIATTIEDCRAIYDESLRHDRVFMLGFGLRYTAVYGRIKEIVSSGALGRLMTIEAKETLGYTHGGSFFRRWHRYKKNNGGFLNAKCCHDLDLINWMVDSDPAYVSAFGSRSYFVPDARAAQKCGECKLKHECRYEFSKQGYEAKCLANSDWCVFNCDKDIVDHEVLSVEYDNGTTATFTVTMLSAAANRTMAIFGSEATLNADFTKGTIEVRKIYPYSETIHTCFYASQGHGGGDMGLYEVFVDTVNEYGREDTYKRRNDARAGLLSTAMALAGEAGMEKKRVVDMKDFLTGV